MLASHGRKEVVRCMPSSQFLSGEWASFLRGSNGIPSEVLGINQLCLLGFLLLVMRGQDGYRRNLL